jgi:aryl-alcohol dehydrogenase
MRDIKAAVMRAPHQPFVIESAQLDSPRANEVLVQLVATGICHTDVAIVDQILPLPAPFVLGHEGAGIVAEVGPDVTGLAPGDHVVLAYSSCGVCDQCGDGHPAYCDAAPLLNFAGRRPDGSVTITDARNEPLNASFFGQSSFATYSIAAARNVVKVADDAPLEYLGPLGCGLMTGAGTVLNVLKPKPQSTLVIFGIGAVGFAALFAAKLLGVERIVAVDRVQSRLDLARELGATQTVNGAETDLAAALAALGGIDYALDTTGAPKVVETAIGALKVRGELALIGASPDKAMTTDIMHLINGRVIRGVVEGDADPQTFIPMLVDRFLAGGFPIDKLTAFYSFDDINDAVADAVSGRVIKPILKFETPRS